MTSARVIVVFVLAMFNSLAYSQSIKELDDYPEAEMNLIWEKKTTTYDLKLFQFDKRGVKNISTSKGKYIFKKGGEISSIINELNPNFFINSSKLRSKDIYFLDLETLEKTPVDAVGKEVSIALAKELNFQFKTQSIVSEAWILKISNKDLYGSLVGVDIPLGVAKSVSMDKKSVHIIGNLEYLGLLLAKHFLSDYVFSNKDERLVAFSIPKGLSTSELNDYLFENYGLEIQRGKKELDYIFLSN